MIFEKIFLYLSFLGLSPSFDLLFIIDIFLRFKLFLSDRLHLLQHGTQTDVVDPAIVCLVDLKGGQTHLIHKLQV
jgi:hypothetical protein